MLEFVQPGKPMEYPFVESFNGSMPDECLNQHSFRNLEVARARIEAHRIDHNELRPHGSLGNLTPREFAPALQRHESGVAVA